MASRQEPLVRTEVVTRTVNVPIVPDQSLRSCGDEPSPRTTQDNVDEAQLFADVLTWGRGCASQLGRTWQSIDEQSAAVVSDQ